MQLQKMPCDVSKNCNHQNYAGWKSISGKIEESGLQSWMSVHATFSTVCTTHKLSCCRYPEPDIARREKVWIIAWHRNFRSRWPKLKLASIFSKFSLFLYSFLKLFESKNKKSKKIIQKWREMIWFSQLCNLKLLKRDNSTCTGHLQWLGR